MKKFENDKGFLIIEMSDEEAESLGFGIDEGCICMHCNDIIKGNIYYIAVLNDVMDYDCMMEWLSWAEHYPEDKEYEERYFNYYWNLLENK